MLGRPKKCPRYEIRREIITVENRASAIWSFLIQVFVYLKSVANKSALAPYEQRNLISWNILLKKCNGKIQFLARWNSKAPLRSEYG